MKIIVILLISLLSFVALGKSDNVKPELKIIRLTDNIYQHISYENIGSYGMVAASGLIVVNGLDAHIIDTPWSEEDTAKLIVWIEDKGLSVKSSVVTHYHEDASGGLPFLNALNVQTYATSLTNSLLKKEGREQSVSDISSEVFEVVTDKIQIFYAGAGHTVDNIVVWLPQDRVLFGGCFVKSLNSKSLGNIKNSSIKDWPNSIQRVINKYPDIALVVPGHGKVGDISLLQHTKQMVLNFSKQ